MAMGRTSTNILLSLKILITMLKNLSRFAFMLVTVLAFVACNNDEDSSPTNTENLDLEELATVANLFEDTESEVEAQLEVFEDQNFVEVASPRGACADITSSLPFGEFPNQITIDFGDIGCLGPNGRLRRGKIIVDISGPMNVAGNTRTATLVDFFLDNVNITGTSSITNQSPDDLTNALNRTVDGQAVFPDGTTIEWSADHVLTQLEGGATKRLIDDVYSILGSSMGADREGNTIQSEISEELIKKFNCPWLVQGVRTITINGQTGTLDYGDGSCNKLAIATLPDGQQFTIRIERWW